MKFLAMMLACCFVLAGCPSKKQESESVPAENVEGTSSAPAGDSDNSPEEMQKKDSSGGSPDGGAATPESK